MTAEFKKAYSFTHSWEKGKVDDPLDRGGRTCDGVTQAVYDKYREDHGLDKQDVYLISNEEKEDIYFNQYWLKMKCDEYPLQIATIVFDASVNHGVGRATKWLQQMCLVEQDGAMGPNTKKAVLIKISELGIDQFTDVFMTRRKAFYDKIVQNNPSQQRFYKGWMNRWNDLNKFVETINN